MKTSGGLFGQAFEEECIQALNAVDWYDVGRKLAAAMQKYVELNPPQPEDES